MIKIEIIDPARENPAMLVKIATLLMDLAGHAIVKAPDDFDKKMEDFEKRMLRTPIEPENIHTKAAERFQENIENLNETVTEFFNPIPEGFRHKPKPQSFEVQGVEQSYKPCIETYENPPYQHCAESGLTEISEEALNEGLKNVVAQDTVGNLGMHILSEKPKSATKRKRTPRKVEVISETGVTEVTEDLINYKEHVNVDVQMSGEPVLPRVEPIENIIPPPAPVLTPMVNGNVLVDKILMARTNGLVTHDEITAIVKKHGIVAVKDIFVNDHLIPLINAELDELLRSK